MQREDGIEQIDTNSRPQLKPNKYMDTRSPREMPQRPKRKLPLYIPKIMAELMWATTKDSTSQAREALRPGAHPHVQRAQRVS